MTHISLEKDVKQRENPPLATNPYQVIIWLFKCTWGIYKLTVQNCDRNNSPAVNTVCEQKETQCHWCKAPKEKQNKKQNRTESQAQSNQSQSCSCMFNQRHLPAAKETAAG